MKRSGGRGAFAVGFLAFGAMAMGAGCVASTDWTDGRPAEDTATVSAAYSTGTWYSIINQNSLACIDDPSGSTSNGTLMQQWDCWFSNNQQWQLISNGSGYYQLQNRTSGLCLDDPGGSKSNGQQMQQWACAGAGSNPNQMWSLNSIGDGFYQIINKNSGLCLDNNGAAGIQGTVSGGEYWGGQSDGNASPAYGTVKQWSCVGGSTNQGWYLSTRGNTSFTHPGAVNSLSNLNYVASNLGNAPFSTAFGSAQGSTYGQWSYSDTPPTNTYCATGQTGVVGQVYCGSTSNPDCHCLDMRHDALAAYTLALIGYLGYKNSGNGSYYYNYTNRAAKILNDWSSNLQSIAGSNAPLQSGWTGELYARAGEILANTTWGAGSSNGYVAFNVGALQNMLSNILVPLMNEGASGSNGNWEAAMADSLIQIGVFNNNWGNFLQGVSMWAQRVEPYFYNPIDGSWPRLPPYQSSYGGHQAYGGTGSGYCTSGSGCDPYGYWGASWSTPATGTPQELCRDTDHSQQALDWFIIAAETAHVQNFPLYEAQATRMTAAMEYLTGILNGGSAPCSVSMPNGVSPAWEIAYNEYHGRLGYNLPNTWNIAIAPHRPETFDATFGMAWETLTHGGVP
jgi:hypothetical protein